MAIAREDARDALIGIATPRLAPPIPATSLIDEYKAAAKTVGIELMPWQVIAARYLTAIEGKRWRFRDVCIVVARQNGKTSLLVPLIYMGLQNGERILHTAQNRELPRDTFDQVAELVVNDPQTTEIRKANGQQTIRFKNGGRYSLVAPRPGVRGYSVDKVLLDEVREQRSFDLLAGIKPTLTASKNPQIVYLSNAGDSDSVVLNDLRRRADKDPSLAYLEWSAPDGPLEDRAKWPHANPALGFTIDLETLEDMFRSLPPPVFETEHGCRWVISMQPRLVPDYVWQRAHTEIEDPLRPAMGISMDVSGKRASAVLAWQQSDGTLALTVLRDVIGDPIDTDRFGPDLRQVALKMGVTQIAYDAWTDSDLARHFKDAKSMVGRDYANASENFVRVLESGRLHWNDADELSDDLTWTARRPHESGAWMAVKANDEHSITSVLAAIRAVWLASAPKQSAPQVF
jgi:phage terminase large subunit-like protein